MVFTFLIAWWWITQFTGSTSTTDQKLTNTLVKQLKNGPTYRRTSTCESVEKNASTIAKWFRINLKWDTNGTRSALIRAKVQESIKQSLEEKLNCDGSDTSGWKEEWEISKPWNGTKEEWATTAPISQPKNDDPVLCEDPMVQIACALTPQGDNCPIACRDHTPPVAKSTYAKMTSNILSLQVIDQESTPSEIFIMYKKPGANERLPLNGRFDASCSSMAGRGQSLHEVYITNGIFRYPLETSDKPDANCVRWWTFTRNDNIPNNCHWRALNMCIRDNVEYPIGTQFKFWATSPGWTQTWANIVSKKTNAPQVYMPRTDTTQPNRDNTKWEIINIDWNYYYRMVGVENDGNISSLEVEYKLPWGNFEKLDWKQNAYCKDERIVNLGAGEYDGHTKQVDYASIATRLGISTSVWTRGIPYLAEMKFDNWVFVFPKKSAYKYYSRWSNPRFYIPEAETSNSYVNCTKYTLKDNNKTRWWEMFYDCNQRTTVLCIDDMPLWTQFKFTVKNTDWLYATSNTSTKAVSPNTNLLCQWYYTYKKSDWTTEQSMCLEWPRWCWPADNIKEEAILKNGCFEWEKQKQCEYFDNSTNSSLHTACLQWRYKIGNMTKNWYYCLDKKTINGKVMDLVNEGYCEAVPDGQWAEWICRDIWKANRNWLAILQNPISLNPGLNIAYTEPNSSPYVWYEYISSPRCTSDSGAIESPFCNANGNGVEYKITKTCIKWKQTCQLWKCVDDIKIQETPYSYKINWQCPSWFTALNNQWCNACYSVNMYKARAKTPVVAAEWIWDNLHFSYYSPSLVTSVRIYMKKPWRTWRATFQYENNQANVIVKNRRNENITFRYGAFNPNISSQIPLCGWATQMLSSSGITENNLVQTNKTSPTFKVSIPNNYFPAWTEIKINILDLLNNIWEAIYTIPGAPTSLDSTPPPQNKVYGWMTPDHKVYWVSYSDPESAIEQVKIQIKKPWQTSFGDLEWRYKANCADVLSWAPSNTELTFTDGVFTNSRRLYEGKTLIITWAVPSFQGILWAWALTICISNNTDFPVWTIFKAWACSAWWCMRRSPHTRTK